MQQFTRPLTREIELGGQRLALTFSSQGIAVRPVGSRKAPHEISWAQLVSAMARPAAGAPPEPGPEELSAALDVLKKGAPAKPAAPAAGGPPPAPAAQAAPSGTPAGMDALLTRLEAWLARHRRHFLEGLAPGATPAELEDLQRRFGVPLPASLRALLAWHNGQTPETLARFEADWSLMSAREIADAKQELDAQAAGGATGWQAAWVPFLDNDDGDYVCLDTAQPGAPVREFWQDRREHPVVAPSLEAWLEDKVTAMERGAYHEDPERGSFLRS
jgi:cell wall assembly regulator SMI1